MFIDVATVRLKAGKGGDGVVSFRHEKYIDKGGPDGGDGGRGGDIVFRATKRLNTLVQFRYKPELSAENGQPGSKRNKRGKTGESLIVDVPIGTVVTRDNQTIADLTEDEQKIIIARGGDGGFGNAHFKSSTRQAPRVAELGEAGEEFEAELELKLIADVGLIGFPNAGKSTFLSVVSNARPEIADYEFTTLTPNLGVADIDDSSLLIADIPGLIEGASEGKGLGDQFLRHIERTAVLVHMIDAYSDDPAEKYRTIRRELSQYGHNLVDKPEIIALTKCDGLDDEIIAMQSTALQREAPEAQIVAISSQTHLGITDLLRLVRKAVDEYRRLEVEQTTGQLDDDAVPVISLSTGQLEDTWSIELVDGVYVVSGNKIEKFARRTNFDLFDGVNRLRDIMRKLGVTHELIRQGAEGSSTIRIGEDEFTLLEQ
ncbi:GTPase ObgE [Candidatus Saccharibacteria bacterium]|nr:GTPase ObgE [Candidatus Saccharibacteria bacterium]